MEIEEITELLPHRYPFLMVDRVLSLTKDEIRAIKNVTINEQFFVGHFTKIKIMPGVMIIEALAQTAALKVLKQRSGKNGPFFLASVNNAKFRHQVKPGDTLTLVVEETRSQHSHTKFKCAAYIEEKLVASMEILAMFTSPPPENGETSSPVQ